MTPGRDVACAVPGPGRLGKTPCPLCTVTAQPSSGKAREPSLDAHGHALSPGNAQRSGAQLTGSRDKGRRQPAWIRLVTVLGLGLVSACSSPATTATLGTSTSTSTATPTTLGSPSSTSSTAAPATSTTAPVPARCTASSVQIGELEKLAATGHLLSVYTLRNTSARPCRVIGYPEIVLLDATGRAITQAQRKGGFILPDRPPAVVNLAPGQVGFLGIESTTVCNDNDPGAMSAKVQVTLPDDTVPAVVPDQIVVCPQPGVLVSPIRATRDDITRS